MKTEVIVLVSLVIGSCPVQLKADESDASGVNVRFIGHASVLIGGENTNVLTDPFWGTQILLGLKRKIPPACAPEALPPINVVLISHTHPDHYDPKNIAKIPGHPVIVMPWGLGSEMRRRGFTVVELRPWHSYQSGAVEVTAVPAKHMVGHCLGYVVKLGGKKLYFAGDTKIFRGMVRLRDLKIDLMMLGYAGTPIWGSTWTSPQAVEALDRISPRMYVPIHWGTFDRWWTKAQEESPAEFMNSVHERLPLLEGRLLKVGETLSLSTESQTLAVNQ